MESRCLLSFGLAVCVLSSLGEAQDAPEDSALGRMVQTVTSAVHESHLEARLFQIVLLDLVPLTLGVDCSASVEVKGGFTVGSDNKYEEATGYFTACDGVRKSPPRLSERAFKTVPCKPRYAEEENTKSCGGDLDEPELEELHRPLQLPSHFLHKTFDSLKSNSVDLRGRYDFQISTVARIASTMPRSEIPEAIGKALDKIRSVNPNSVVLLIEGRQTNENGETTTALVDAETGSILGISRSSAMILAPPTRPH